MAWISVSPLVRGEWIEIITNGNNTRKTVVSPRERGVD